MPSRLYLSGLDWIIGALDYSMRRDTGMGNASQIVLLLDGCPDADELSARLSEFLPRFPLIAGSIKRDWLNLAPYWKIASGARMPRLATYDLDAPLTIDDYLAPEAMRVLEGYVNTPFGGGADLLSFNLTRFVDGRAALSMGFDHKILDARGAEMLLDLFVRYAKGELALDEASAGLERARPAGLTRWAEKFLSGRDVNRRFIEMKSRGEARTLPMPVGRGRVDYHVRRFSVDETARVLGLAAERAGFMMELPYVLSRTLGEMGALFGAPKDALYVVPVTVDTRVAQKGAGPASQIFFNYSSFMFFTVPDAASSDEAISAIKHQMYDQAQMGFPQKLAHAAQLMRIAPFGLIDAIIRRFFGKGSSSLSFSYLGRQSFKSGAVMGVNVLDLLHMPRVPAPPGLGVFFNTFGGRMSMTISWMDGLMERSAAGRLADDIAAGLMK